MDGFLPIEELAESLECESQQGWELLHFCEADGGFAVVVAKDELVKVE